MAKVTKRVDTPLSADELWGIVGDPGQVGWVGSETTLVDDVRSTYVPGPGGELMRERILSVDPEGRHYEFSILESSLKLDHHVGTIAVEPNGDQSTLVWTMEFEPDSAEERITTVLNAVTGRFVEKYGF